jgi:tryptophan synthase alpha chain
MSAIDLLFRQYRAEGKKALIPFITAGDPDLQFTRQVIEELARRGCALCEVGIPYSDPIADGPIIQASYTRALANKVRLAGILEMLRHVELPSSPRRMPLVTMVSYAIIHRLGLERFVEDAQAAGVSGAIVPDLLVDEAEPLARICAKADFSLIQLVTPTTPRPRAVRIAATSTGFLYYVSVTGITGERRELPPELVDNVGWLREQTELPICIGFGISGPDQVKRLAPVADGLIVGSAFVRRLNEAGSLPSSSSSGDSGAAGESATTVGASRADVLRDVGQFATELLEALR